MQYKAHLDTGRIIDMTFDVSPEAFVLSGWLVDKNGVMVSAQHLMAMEPVLTDAPVLPQTVVDGDGDVWKLSPEDGEGMYRDTYMPAHNPLPLARIRAKYGIEEMV